MLVSESNFDSFRSELAKSHIDFSRVGWSKSQVEKIEHIRTVFQSCLGHDRTKATLYYTLPEPTALAKDEKDLKQILIILEAQSRLPFTKSHAARLGNFEIFDLPPWLEKPAPVTISQIKGDNHRDALPILEICRSEDFSKKLHTAHVIARTRDEVFLDKLIQLQPKTCRNEISVPERPLNIELWLFEDSHEGPVYYEKTTFLNQITFNTGMLGPTVEIQDEFSKRAKSQSLKGLEKLTKTTKATYQKSSVGGYSKNTWQSFADQMNLFCAQNVAVENDDQWFDQGLAGEADVITHMRSRMDNGNVVKAVLVDPWFGSESVARLLSRLGATNFQLTIITSWTRTNPDDNQKVSSFDNPTSSLEEALNKVQKFLNPNTTVINLVSNGKQAFHDRYLLLYPDEGVPKVFLLSNSINKMAENWPFVMSLISPPTATKVRDYIEGLCQGKDLARTKQLTETFRWPNGQPWNEMAWV